MNTKQTIVVQKLIQLIKKSGTKEVHFPDMNVKMQLDRTGPGLVLKSPKVIDLCRALLGAGLDPKKVPIQKGQAYFVAILRPDTSKMLTLLK